MYQIKSKFLMKITLGVVLFIMTNSVLFGQAMGDANNDSVVNVVDALIVAQAYVGLNPSPYYPLVADVNCSGKADIVDALLITQYYIGIVEQFCENRTPLITARPPITTFAPRDNPFSEAKMYVDPIWSEMARNGGGAAIADESTAINLNHFNTLFGSKGLPVHLDNALAQGADLITLVVNSMPNKDCGRNLYASYGSNLDKLFIRYQQEFIDPMVSILSDAKYSSLKIICIVEPQTLHYLVSSGGIPGCEEMYNSGGYSDGVQYALNQLNTLSNTYCYLSIGHSGWMGWPDNFAYGVRMYSSIVKGTDRGVNSIAGFISNFASYTPVEEPFLPDPQLSMGEYNLLASSFYEWNPYFDELEYAQDFREAIIKEGFPESIGMLIDTGRNGWGGPNRPIAVSTSTDLDTYVNESRIDRRYHRGNWCNQPGGIGYRPQANSAPGIHAFVWAYAPGISDGISNTDFESEPTEYDQFHDPMCDPDGFSIYVSSYPTGAIEAPFAGKWNQAHFEILLKNAYPLLEETE